MDCRIHFWYYRVVESAVEQDVLVMKSNLFYGSPVFWNCRQIYQDIIWRLEDCRGRRSILSVALHWLADVLRFFVDHSPLYFTLHHCMGFVSRAYISSICCAVHFIFELLFHISVFLQLVCYTWYLSLRIAMIAVFSHCLRGVLLPFKAQLLYSLL